MAQIDKQKYQIQKRLMDLINTIRTMEEKKVVLVSLNPQKTIIELPDKRQIFYKYQNGKYIEIPKDTLNLEENVPKKLKHSYNLKTRKGKIISQNAKKILVPPLMTLSIGLAFLGAINKQEKVKTKNEITIETLQDKESMNTIINLKIPNFNSMINSKLPETTKSEPTPTMISQLTNVEVESKTNMIKRMETDNLFGQSIQYYATRYGIPTSLASALITQERPDIGMENIGQLTRKICGEKYQVPIIIPTESEKYDGISSEKIFIVRDEPIKENFENPDSYRKELERYQNQLIKSQELEKEGYHIFYFGDLMNDPAQNIHISMAYLAHSVYGCNLNVHLGTRAYNSGIASAKNATDEDLVNGNIEIGDPFYNKNVLSYLYPEELTNVVWTLKNINSEEQELIAIAMNFNNIKDRNYEYASQEDGPHL